MQQQQLQAPHGRCACGQWVRADVNAITSHLYDHHGWDYVSKSLPMDCLFAQDRQPCPLGRGRPMKAKAIAQHILSLHFKYTETRSYTHQVLPAFLTAAPTELPRDARAEMRRAAASSSASTSTDHRRSRTHTRNRSEHVVGQQPVNHTAVDHSAQSRYCAPAPSSAAQGYILTPGGILQQHYRASPQSHREPTATGYSTHRAPSQTAYPSFGASDRHYHAQPQAEFYQQDYNYNTSEQQQSASYGTAYGYTNVGSDGYNAYPPSHYQYGSGGY